MAENGEKSLAAWERRSKWYVTLVFIAAIASVAFYFWNFAGPPSPEQTVWGAFGDYFGGVLSPIVSFVALLALFHTIHLQAGELRLTRKELEASTNALKENAINTRRASFELFFFNTLKLYNDLLGELNHGKHPKSNGKGLLKNVLKEDEFSVKAAEDDTEPDGIWTLVHGPHEAAFATLSTLYQLLEQLDEPDDYKARFTLLLENQLTEAERRFYGIYESQTVTP